MRLVAFCHLSDSLRKKSQSELPLYAAYAGGFAVLVVKPPITITTYLPHLKILMVMHAVNNGYPVYPLAVPSWLHPQGNAMALWVIVPSLRGAGMAVGTALALDSVRSQP